jgi:hypothetical protein
MQNANSRFPSFPTLLHPPNPRNDTPGAEPNQSVHSRDLSNQVTVIHDLLYPSSYNACTRRQDQEGMPRYCGPYSRNRPITPPDDPLISSVVYDLTTMFISSLNLAGSRPIVAFQSKHPPAHVILSLPYHSHRA